MLKKFKKKYNLNIKILKDKKLKCNRSLSTIYNMNKKLKIPTFDKMLNELE
jgi:peroxiredoxin